MGHSTGLGATNRKRVGVSLALLLLVANIVPASIASAANNPPTILSPTVFTSSQTPKVDGQSGALTQSITLDVPPGRNGLQPTLSLQYNSQNTDQDSIVGYGWSLSIPYIQRLNKTGSQNLYGSNPYFTSSLDGELALTTTSNAVSVLVVGGGGTGGSGSAGTDPGGGGGGGGGVVASSSYAITPQAYTVTVGSSGGNSVFGIVTAYGGGAGGAWNGNGSSGGSGGGGGCFGSSGAGTSGQGTAGGGGANAANCGGAGGGGASGPGSNSSGGNGGNGGSGVYSLLSGFGATYGGGGGGGSFFAGGNGGLGGGGSGGQTGVNGSPASGGGGGGSSDGYSSGAGGSGIVIVSYPTSQAANYSCGGSKSVSGSNTICSYTASGSFTVNATTTPATTPVYSARIDDGSFRQYSYATSTNSWTMFDKNGTEYLFGASSQSQESATTSPSNVYRWMLEKEVDANGNYIRYVYHKDANQIYPYEILYDGSGASDGPLTVTFATSTRTDQITSFKTGFQVNTNFRISQITAAVSGTTVRQYNLGYATGDNGFRSLLSSIQENGWSDNNVETSQPATAFAYVNATSSFVSQNGAGGPAYVVADTNGDGINDVNLFYKNNAGTNSAFINGTSQSFVPALVWAQYSGGSPSYVASEDGVRYVDVNGDGKADMVQGILNYTTPANSDALYLNTYTPASGYGWSATTSWNGVIPQFWITGSGSLEQSTGIFGDVNGDGLPDYEQDSDAATGLTNGAYIGNGSAWNAATTTIFSPVEPMPDNLGAINYDSRLVDINGDGLSDWEWTDGANIYFDLDSGSGWGPADPNYTIATSSLYHSGGNYYDRGIRFVDVNGDGLPDFVHSYSVTTTGGSPELATYSTVMLNTGSGWATSTAYTFAGYVVSGTGTTYNELANFTGNGQQDQDVLSAITYPKGGSTGVTYGYTTQSATNPQLPYDLLVVTALVNHDGRGSSEETDYSYSGGLQYLPSNVIDRKFGGFASVSATSSVSTTVTYYSQGATSSAVVPGDQSDGYGQINHPFRQDVLSPADVLLSRTFYQYNPIWHGNSEFVGLTRQLEQDYGVSGAHQDKDTDYKYSSTTDDLLETDDYGAVTGNSDGTFADISGDSRTTKVIYAASSSIDLAVPTEKTVLNNSGATTTDAKFFYDGLAFGSVGIGNQTQEQDWVSGTHYASTTKSYNSYGLVTRSTDANGNATTYAYDSFNMYPATTTNALSQTTEYTYEYPNGKVEQTTNVDNLISKNTYDGVGRIVGVFQPDLTTPSTLATSTIYAYVDSTTTPSQIHRSDYLSATSTVDTYDYYDGLGRLIQERASTATSNVFAVHDVAFNTAGLQASVSLPYLAAGSSWASATTSNSNLISSYTYDGLNRVLKITNAVGSTVNSYAGWIKNVLNPLGEMKSYYGDAYGNLAEVDEGSNNGATSTTKYAYDPSGNMTSFTDALGNVRNFAYDGLNRRVSAQDLHAAADTTFGMWNYAYDDVGNLASTTDAKGQTILHTFDALSRTLTETYTGQAGTAISYTYDSCAYGVSLLCTASTTAEKTSYGYDPIGLPQIATTTIGGISYATQYAYTRRGDQQIITSPDGSQAQYAFDAGGNVSSIQEEEKGGSFANILNSVTYAPNGLPSVIWYGNGATTTNTYNASALYRLTNRVTATPASTYLIATSSGIAFDSQVIPACNDTQGTSCTWSHTVSGTTRSSSSLTSRFSPIPAPGAHGTDRR